MGVYIPNMEMPNSCGECQFICKESTCRYGKGYERSDFCPLIEVPPHGLIDKQMLLRNVADNQLAHFSVEEDYAFWGKVWDYIFDAPTIIEAEPDCTTCPVKGKACKVFYRDKGDNSVCRELREAEGEDDNTE